MNFEASQQLLRDIIQKKQRMVAITIYVPADTIDFTSCDVIPSQEDSEMWGAPVSEKVIDYDLSSATYNGIEIESFQDEDEVIQYLAEEY